MIRKYLNHKLQTNARDCEKELQDIYSNKTSKNTIQLCLSRQDECKTRKDI